MFRRKKKTSPQVIVLPSQRQQLPAVQMNARQGDDKLAKEPGVGHFVAFKVRNASTTATLKVILFDANGEIQKALNQSATPTGTSIVSMGKDYEAFRNRIVSRSDIHVSEIRLNITAGESSQFTKPVQVLKGSNNSDFPVPVHTLYPELTKKAGDFQEKRAELPTDFKILPDIGVVVELEPETDMIVGFQITEKK